MTDLDLGKLSGYDLSDRYFATHYTQGGREVYSLDLSLLGIVQLVPRPDPTRPAQGNRQIDVKHAREFGAYVRERREWVSPALILRAPSGSFEFEKKNDLGGGEVGVLSVPRVARTELRLLDGQHRVLGLHLAFESLVTELEKARAELQAARISHPDQVDQKEAVVKQLLLQRDRFSRERISVQIVLEDDEPGYKQMFADIADHAKGITRTLRARFDRRQVANRALEEVIQHPLLVGRVEDQLDRVKDENQLLAAKHVVEVIRAVAVGAGGRISPKKETELDEADLVVQAFRFLSSLTSAFPALKEVEEGKLVPAELRGDGPRGSLLGSATMLRVLAGVYHDLSQPSAPRGESVPEAWTDTRIVEFFASLDPHMGAPVPEGLWTGTELVDAGAHAPRARGGDIRHLADLLVGWAREGLPLGEEKPAAEVVGA